MGGIVITWPQIAVVGLIVLGIYVAELLIFLRKVRHGKAGNQRLLEAEQDSQRDEITMLRRELAALRARLDELPVEQAVAEPESAYGQAMKLAQQGMDSAAVAAGCGISRGEAELIVALYRASQQR